MNWSIVAAIVAAAVVSTATASAADIRVMCYQDGNECVVYKDLADRFMKDHPDIRITLDTVPYPAILQSLPVQLAAGNGPDIARVTSFGILEKYMLNLRPLLPDAQQWDTEFGPVLDWTRADPKDNGIYGLPTQLTVTGPFVNKTLFDQAGVGIPPVTATWDDWATAVEKVAKATQTPYGMAWDRSGHRLAGPAISYGAKYFAVDGAPAVIDPGFKEMASRFVAWNQDGTVEKDVWAATGSGYRDDFTAFSNAQIVVYYSGSWWLRRMDQQIGGNFDWQAVPHPCGPVACTGMPGGAAFVGFKQTKNPQAVAAFLDYLQQPDIYRETMERTDNIPAEIPLLKSGVDYKNLSAAGQAAMKAFLESAQKLVPLAYRLQGYKYNSVIFDATVNRISQVIAGQLTVDQAYQRITQDIQQQLAAAKQ
jgi:alpha-1,4-digalacturonate transport system substrate-binding protein